MSLYQDIRDVVSGFVNPFTTQDVIDALPGYKPLVVRTGFQNLVSSEAIAENISLLTRNGLYIASKGVSRILFNSMSSHPVVIDGIAFPTLNIGCKAFKLNRSTVNSAFTAANKRLKAPALTITCCGHTITRSHN